MDGTASGSTATEMNQSRGNRSNQCVTLFMDYLYLHFTIKNTQRHISRILGHTPEPGSRRSTNARTMEGGVGKGRGSALGKRGGALWEGEGNIPVGCPRTVE